MNAEDLAFGCLHVNAFGCFDEFDPSAGREDNGRRIATTGGATEGVAGDGHVLGEDHLFANEFALSQSLGQHVDAETLQRRIVADGFHHVGGAHGIGEQLRAVVDGTVQRGHGDLGVESRIVLTSILHVAVLFGLLVEPLRHPLLGFRQFRFLALDQERFVLERVFGEDVAPPLDDALQDRVEQMLTSIETEISLGGIFFVVADQARDVFQRQSRFRIQLVDHPIGRSLFADLPVVDLLFQRIVRYHAIDETRFRLTIPLKTKFNSIFFNQKKRSYSVN